MFEFAIAQHRKRPPTKRFLASLTVSCFLHAVALITVIENPGLLRTGRSMWIRLPDLLQPPPKEANWRMVTLVGSAPRMPMPSSETLRRALYGLRETRRGSPPVRVRLGEERPGSRKTTPERVPAVRPTLGTKDPKPVPESVATSRTPDPAGAEQPGSKAGEGSRAESPVALAGNASPSERKPVIYLPPPESSPPRRLPDRIGERAENNQPAGIPKSLPGSEGSGSEPKPSSQREDQPRVFQDEKAAIRTEGSGLFDTRGFPLGDYARLIIDRIKGNWSIPSNLRSSQGRSTLIFFIQKDGTVTDLRIVVSSGSHSLDISALHAVILSKPLPPLPGGFPGAHVGAKFTFSYNEP